MRKIAYPDAEDCVDRIYRAITQEGGAHQQATAASGHQELALEETGTLICQAGP